MPSRSGLAQKPDLICLTGDFITHRQDFDAGAYSPGAAAAFGGRADVRGPRQPRRRKLDGASPRQLPITAWWSAFWRTAGSNCCTTGRPRFAVRGRCADAGGGRRPLVERGRAAAGVCGRRAASTPTILLAHNPGHQGRREVSSLGPDVERPHARRAGDRPVEGPRYAPVKDKRYIAGLKSWGTRQIHVTRGVGNVGGVRLGCRPEASLLVVGYGGYFFAAGRIHDAPVVSCRMK